MSVGEKLLGAGAREVRPARAARAGGRIRVHAEELQKRVGDASKALGPPDMLEAISDHLFVMQEAPDQLGVPYAFASTQSNSWLATKRTSRGARPVSSHAVR